MTKKRIAELTAHFSSFYPKELSEKIVEHKLHNHSRTRGSLLQLFEGNRCRPQSWDSSFKRGNECYDSFDEVEFLLKEAGIEFIKNNDAPKGGRKGDYIILYVKYHKLSLEIENLSDF